MGGSAIRRSVARFLPGFFSWKSKEGPEWEAMQYHYRVLHKAVESQKSGENKQANVLWAMKEAKVEGNGLL